MALNKFKLGDLIELVDERNSENLFDANSVVGLGTQKEIIKTKADLDGVSLTSYKLFPPKTFAYVPDTSRRGDKISLVLNDEKFSVIVSPISLVFNVEKEKLLPRYLMLWLSRSEFDRYARFHSWGSARETFSFDEMCEVEIPIAEMKYQKSIVEIYEVLQTRKKILEQLKSQIKRICPILIKGSLDEGEMC